MHRLMCKVANTRGMTYPGSVSDKRGLIYEFEARNILILILAILFQAVKWNNFLF